MVFADEPKTLDLEQRARQGDAAAFGELIRAHDRDLRGVVWGVVRNQTDTDDVMQQAYEKAFRSIKTFDGRSTMKTWLHTICYRVAIDYVRYEGRRRHEDQSVLDQRPIPGPEGPALDRLEVTDSLDQLDPEQRALLMLTAWQGYTFEEAAEIVGTQRGTVSSRMSRVRKKMTRWERL